MLFERSNIRSSKIIENMINYALKMFKTKSVQNANKIKMIKYNLSYNMRNNVLCNVLEQKSLAHQKNT